MVIAQPTHADWLLNTLAKARAKRHILEISMLYFIVMLKFVGNFVKIF